VAAVAGADAETTERGERDGRRRGRGRNRRERGDEALSTDASPPVEAGAEAQAMPAPESELSPVTAAHEKAVDAPVETVSEPAPPAQAEAAPVLAAAPAEATAPTQPPAVTAAPAPAAARPLIPAPEIRFRLPTDELQAIADAAGLQWVNSDADKIRAVQEAMAREPRPVHVPRQPRPVVQLDEGPLVLVETRKDLSQIRLPFENQPPAA
jgi:ribonuclease E